jgi:hypothetical protein
VLRERDRIGLGLHRQGAKILARGTEHSTDRAAAVVDPVDDGLGERHEPPHQVKRQVGARLTDPLGDRCPREVQVVHEIRALDPSARSLRAATPIRIKRYAGSLQTK